MADGLPVRVKNRIVDAQNRPVNGRRLWRTSRRPALDTITKE